RWRRAPGRSQRRLRGPEAGFLPCRAETSGAGAGDGIPLDGDALDARPEPAQALVDALVAAVDLPDVADRGRALGGEARNEHGHSRADVRALHALAVELRRPADHDAVRVAEDDPGAHSDELVHEEQAALEHLLEHED